MYVCHNLLSNPKLIKYCKWKGEPFITLTSQTLYAAMVASLEHLSLILFDHNRSRIRCIDLREVGPRGNLLKEASSRTLCVTHLAMSQQLVGRINVALCHTECYQVLGRLQHASRGQFSCTKEKED